MTEDSIHDVPSGIQGTCFLSELMLVRRPEEQILVCVARRSHDVAMAEQLRELAGTDLDWEYLLATAHHHCLVPLLYLHLNAAASSVVPPQIMGRLERDNHQNTRLNLFLTGDLLKVLELLKENGIVAIPFKGPTLALRAFGDVGLRQFGDLDILVHRKDILKVKELLISRGFQSMLALTASQQAALLRFDCAYNFKNERGVVLDVHWELVERHFGFDFETNHLWDRLEPVTISDKQLMTLSTEDLLLILCLHGFTHLWDRLGWICDVASLIDSRKDLNWQLVLENAKTLGARRILSLGLFLASDLLGAAMPPEVWKAVQPDAQVKKLAGQIREQLFTSRSSTGGKFAEAVTLVTLRERRSDRLRACLRLAASPRSYDWMFLSVPDSLFFLYYLVRPLRLAGKYGTKLLMGWRIKGSKTNGDGELS
jgi:hypothetical protein